MYQIIFQINIKKYLKNIPANDSMKILDAIGNLAKNPRPRAVKKLQSREGYRIRVGNYRVIYKIDDGRVVVYIIDIDHRKDIYNH